MTSEPPQLPPVVGQQTQAAATDPPKQESSLKKYINNKWLVLLLLFGCTAALGLPVLWKSTAFSRGGKVFWSVIVSLYTVLIFYIFFKIMAWSYGRISQVF